jgi:hypothetical protein
MKYVRYNNIFTGQAGDFLVRTIDVPTITEERFCRQIALFNEGITEEQAVLALNLINKALKSFIQQGFSVKTRFAEFRLGAKGLIDSEGKKNVKCTVRAKISRELEEIAAENKMEETQPSRTGPSLFSIKDVSSGLVDEALTPGGIAVILGRSIKVENGSVKLRNTETGAVTEVAGNYAENKPGTVIFLIPAGLEHGVYRVSVETTYSGAVPYIEPKTGELDIDLAVPPPAQSGAS